MTKRIHPIRKMQRDIWSVRSDRAKLERRLARHLKPLLDALEGEHCTHLHRDEYGIEEDCDVCRLLAQWQEEL